MMPILDRRTLVWGGGLSLVAGGVLADPRGRPRIATPSQDEGPFYPVDPDRVSDNDLVRLTGMDAQALGTVVHLRGVVFDRNGAPVPGARVEIWQADATGKYNHPAQEFVEHRDPRFQGFGATLTDRRGRYGFRTLRPVIYEVALGRNRMMRAAHIHIAVYLAGQKLLTTQLYRSGDPYLPHDPLFAGLSLEERDLVLANFLDGSDIEPESLKTEFNLFL